MQLRSHYPRLVESARSVSTFFRVMAPTLIALSFATVAHAHCGNDGLLGSDHSYGNV